jgi:HSF-type DNA-binding
MLADTEKEGKSDVISFYSHGRAFAVHDIDRFVADVMPKYFKQSKWNSFARQLNLYGFVRITSGPDAGGWYHELFLKGRPNLCFHMRRVGVPKGRDRRKFKTPLRTVEPDFYSMKKVDKK